MKLFSRIGFTKLEKLTRKILDAFHIKNSLYKLVIIPAQMLALNRVRKIAKTPVEKQIVKTPKKILFMSVDARHMPHTYLEASIAKALQLRGHEVKMIICGCAMNMCTTFHRLDHPPNKWSCINCKNFSKKFYETINLPYVTYLDYLTQEKIDAIYKKIEKMTVKQCEDFVYKKVEVGYHATTSVERYFMGATPPKEQYEKILRMELANAMITTDVAEQLNIEQKWDLLVTSHACYSSWGSFADFFAHNKIRFAKWGTVEQDKIAFDRWRSDEYFEIYKKDILKGKNLPDKAKTEIEEFLDKRSKGKQGQVQMYGFSDISKEKLEAEFKFKDYEKNYVMFPNVPWDAGLVGEKAAFASVLEWVYFTIDQFVDRPKHQLIIKIHPSEAKVMESKETVKEAIEEKYPNLPDNIKIIPSDTSIPPYALFEFMDVGIVYNGTVGLEMSIYGIPVIVSYVAHYSNKGFTYDVKSKNHYKKLLHEDLKPQTDHENLVKTYAYFHFIKKAIPRDWIRYDNFFTTGWKLNSFEDITSGKNKNIDHICKYLVEGGIFQDW